MAMLNASLTVNLNGIFMQKSINMLVKIEYNTIQYNIRLLEAVRTQRRTMREREK